MSNLSTLDLQLESLRAARETCVDFKKLAENHRMAHSDPGKPFRRSSVDLMADPHQILRNSLLNKFIIDGIVENVEKHLDDALARIDAEIKKTGEAIITAAVNAVAQR